ncbi:MFS transporter [Bacillus sp. FJAT-27445]|uniref:MFS transporter n=1 Tax=Bacillus sp. FJAT-27445 TaxID=1679166 RepID=UPI000743C569|nr:MFS transporter [Bacillus sp. FJAT-27445]
MFSFLKRNPRYFRYWIATWFSEFGDWARNMTLMFMVLELSNHSPVAVSLNMFFEFAPIFIFGSIVGVFADRWNRKMTMIFANIFRVSMIPIFMLALLFESLTLIYLGAFMCAIGTLFYRAPGPAFIMQFVAEEDRKTAASLRQLTVSIMMLVGAGIGTTLYVWLGAIWSLGLNMFVFLISVLLILSIKVSEQNEVKSNQKNLGSIWLEMREGFQYSWSHPIVRPILFTNVFVGFGSGLINVSSVFILTEFLGLSEKMFGLFVSLQGGGMLLSVYLVSKIKLSMNRMVSYGMIIVGVGLIGLVIYPSLYITSIFLLLFCFGQVALNIGLGTLMQTKVDYQYQGRAGMTINTVSMGFMVIAMLFTGWLHELFTIQPLIMLGGILIVCGGVLCFILFLRVINSKDEVLVTNAVSKLTSV